MKDQQVFTVMNVFRTHKTEQRKWIRRLRHEFGLTPHIQGVPARIKRECCSTLFVDCQNMRQTCGAPTT